MSSSLTDDANNSKDVYVEQQQQQKKAEAEKEVSSSNNNKMNNNSEEQTNQEINLDNANPNSASNSQMSGMSSMFSSASGFDLNQIKPHEWISRRRQTLRPWTEFGSTRNFKNPASPQQALSRTYQNLLHFQTNYMFVFSALAVYCVITSPYLLMSFMALAGACYIMYLKNKEGQVTIAGRQVKLGQLYTVLGCVSIPIFLIAGAGSALFWIIGASVVCILLHAVFYSRDEQEDPFTAQLNIA